jgi:hypothetical protein
MTTLLVLLSEGSIWAASQQLPGGGPGQSAGAGSPFTTYDAGVAIYMLLIAGLVTVLLIGGFLILNYGMMSKRPNDRYGKRTPSEPAFFKNQMWPPEPYEQNQLPAEEDDFETARASQDASESHVARSAEEKKIA